MDRNRAAARPTRAPEAAGIRPGRQTDALVQLTDVLPTLMSLVGVAPEHPHFGMDLVSLMRGETDRLREAVFAEGGHLPGEPHAYDEAGPVERPLHAKMALDPIHFSKAVMVRTEEWKLVWRYTGEHELYYLASDPGEEHNCFADPACATARERLTAMLLDWFLQTGDTVPLHRDVRWGPDEFRRGSRPA